MVPKLTLDGIDNQKSGRNHTVGEKDENQGKQKLTTATVINHHCPGKKTLEYVTKIYYQ